MSVQIAVQVQARPAVQVAVSAAPKPSVSIAVTVAAPSAPANWTQSQW